MRFKGGEFSTGTTGNFQSELTNALAECYPANPKVDKWLTNRLFGGDPPKGEE